MLVCKIFVIFSDILYLPPVLRSQQPPECYDKSELSNQSSDEELRGKSSVLTSSLAASQPSHQNWRHPSNITYSTGSDNATRQRKRHIAIAP